MADHFASTVVSTRKTRRHLVAFHDWRNWGDSNRVEKPNGTGNFRKFRISRKKDNLERWTEILETKFRKISVPFDFNLNRNFRKFWSNGTRPVSLSTDCAAALMSFRYPSVWPLKGVGCWVLIKIAYHFRDCALFVITPMRANPYTRTEFFELRVGACRAGFSRSADSKYNLNHLILLLSSLYCVCLFVLFFQHTTDLLQNSRQR